MVSRFETYINDGLDKSADWRTLDQRKGGINRVGSGHALNLILH